MARKKVVRVDNTLPINTVVLVEFHLDEKMDLAPYAVWAVAGPRSFNEYECEWSKRLGKLLCCLVGDSHALSVADRSNHWWADKGYDRPWCEGEKALVGKRLKVMPPGWDPDTILKDAIECEAVLFCSVCQDWFTSEDRCDHVWWCDECEWWGGPGADEPCEHER